MTARRIRVFCCVPLLAAMLLFAATLHHAAQRVATSPEKTVAAPAPIGSQPAEKLHLNGVPNFGRVTDTLYRSGQPSAAGFQELKKLGIEIVVNFRNERGEVGTEQHEVEALGLRYVSIPWSSFHDPASRQVAEFLELLQGNPRQKIFVHCHHGADRTGVMVAAFRIAMQNWTPRQALAEMKAFGFHSFWYPHLGRYIENFPQRLKDDPNLRALHPAAHPSTP
jgi:protein tyrosine phosphatase (PTP) superfamily phosphohydrolase (DUF442 family)